MRISDTLVRDLLLKGKKITIEQIKAAHDAAGNEKLALQDAVLNANLITEKDLTKLYAEEIDVPYIDLNGKEIQREILKLIPERIAKQYNVVLYGVQDDGSKLLAMDDPDDIQAVNFLKKQLGNDIKVSITTHQNILTALDQYRGNMSSELTKVISPDEQVEEDDDEVSEEDVAEDSPIAQTVNLLIEYAVKAGASDVHIEPREGHVLVRYRVDGILKEANKGDQYAIELIADAAYKIGRGLSILIHIMNPKVIVLSGRSVKVAKLMLAPIQQALNKYCIPRLFADTEIKVSKLGFDAELIGASILVMQNFGKEKIK